MRRMTVHESIEGAKDRRSAYARTMNHIDTILQGTYVLTEELGGNPVGTVVEYVRRQSEMYIFRAGGKEFEVIPGYEILKMSKRETGKH